jgi:Ni,Fe-hydrogenase III large subunit
VKIDLIPINLQQRKRKISEAIASGARLGFITSIDGGQLITAMLWPETGLVECFETALDGCEYPSLSKQMPQAHWYERTAWDMFGLYPKGHPRLKHTHLHEPYASIPAPLSLPAATTTPDDRQYHFLDVEGPGIYEIPVGPIHAGIIEPGHFRFSCYGEVIVNLEIKLGYVHRGIEKRLTEIDWWNTRFVVEAAASDMAVAQALANATIFESFFDTEIPRSSQLLRTIAAELERVAMHISDLGGLATDVGFLGIASSLSRLRGCVLGACEALSGNRFMRGYICPGGVQRQIDAKTITAIREQTKRLRADLKPVIDMYLNNQVAMDRMDGIGKISTRLASEFGLVGVPARACGIPYDCRTFSMYATFPEPLLPISVDNSGDILARAKVRINEIDTSLNLIANSLEELESTSSSLARVQLPRSLPPNKVSIAIVESHRGELIHFATTNSEGTVARYYIKDPSVNNWTALAIAVRSHVVADFPLCNKSFSLSYSGHDL